LRALAHDSAQMGGTGSGTPRNAFIALKNL
jgi:hypothetical protein